MTQPSPSSSSHVAIIGGGPAGLMAAEVLSQAGIKVDLYDGMPSVGRKFLLAGVGGMNITHSEAYPAFLSRYAERAPQIAPLLRGFGADALCQWIHDLGIETFVGSSGRVFPTDMKAAPCCVHGSNVCVTAALLSTPVTAGSAGLTAEDCASTAPKAKKPSNLTQPCWPSAAAAGRGSARTAPGCCHWNNTA